MDDSHVLLYHGTWGGAVENIRRHGLGFVDVDAEARHVADRVGLNARALREFTDQLGFTGVWGRESFISLAGHPIFAALYAGVAGGEARRELFQAAWLLMHDSDDQHTADIWSFEQTRSDRILVTVSVPAEVALAGLNVAGGTLGLEHVPTRIEVPIEQPIPADWIVVIGPIERVWRPDDVEDVYGRRPSFEELPSDSPLGLLNVLWWQSSVERWLSAG